MSNCKVKTAFARYVSYVSKIYNETKDVYRCGNILFKQPKCECEECMKKGSSLWSSSPEDWEKIDLGMTSAEIFKVLDKKNSKYENGEFIFVEKECVSKIDYDVLKAKLSMALSQRNYLIDNYYNEKGLPDQTEFFDAELSKITPESIGGE